MKKTFDLEVGYGPLCEPVEREFEANHKSCERYLKGLQKRWPTAKFEIVNVKGVVSSKPYHTIVLSYDPANVEENQLTKTIELNLPEVWSDLED